MSGAICKEGCTACPACRGEVRADSQAMHDVEFAVAMARWDHVGSTDPRWRALAVAQTVRDSMARRHAGGDEDSRVLGFVGMWASLAQGLNPNLVRDSVSPVPSHANRRRASLGVQFEDSGSSSGPAIAPPTPDEEEARARWGDEAAEKLGYAERLRRAAAKIAPFTGAPHGPRIPAVTGAGGPPYEFFLPGQDVLVPTFEVPGVERHRCCADLNYPVPEPYMVHSATGLYVHFDMAGLYSDAMPCRCGCCLFMQFVLGYITKDLFIKQGPIGWGPSIPDFVEDCHVVDSNGQFIGKTPEGDRADHPGESVECMPGQWDRNDAARHGDHGMIGTSFQSCWWKNWDEPGTYLWLGNITIGLDYLGVVFDICNNMRIADINCFHIYAEMETPGGTPAGYWAPCSAPVRTGNTMRRERKR